MNEFLDMAALLALLRAHWIIASFVTLLLCLAAWGIYIKKNIDARYTPMRIWLAFPLIGKIASLSREKPDSTSGWPSVEKDLCEKYIEHYNRHSEKQVGIYLKSKDYLAKIGEAGRRPIPTWVLALSFGLLILEAVGFAFVLGPWINPNVSATQMGYLAWSVAFFLALISGFFAHFAGHHAHYNSIVKKAHAWWSHDTKNPKRPSSLKQLPAVSIDQTYSDSDQPDYQQIMARISADANVAPKKSAIYGFFAVIMIFAVAAFWIRADTLKSIETDLVDMQEVSADLPTLSSPFDLPAESAGINADADNQRIEEKMAAIRSASLVTYIVLSVVYVAIQVVMFWLSIKYGFAGTESRLAWDITHKFKTAEQYDTWLKAMRNKISAHADHDLRALQRKRAGVHTAVADEQETHGTARVEERSFLAFVRMLGGKGKFHEQQMADIDAVANQASPIPKPTAPAPELAAGTTSPDSTQAPTIADPLKFTDLTDLDELELADVADSFEEDLETLTSIRRKQLALKKLGRFPAQAEVTA